MTPSIGPMWLPHDWQCLQCLMQDVEWHHILARFARWDAKGEEVFKAAQKNPAAVNKSDSSGWTALHFAAAYAGTYTFEAMVPILLNAGADPNARSTEWEGHGSERGFLPGSTPLHCAADCDIPDSPESDIFYKA